MELRLHQAAEDGEVSTVRKILKNLPKVDVNDRDNFYSSPLAKACKSGHLEIARLLIEAQADLNSIDTNALTPLHFAAKGNHVEVVKLLVLNGARLDVASNTNLHPIDLVRYNSETWTILRDAKKGDMPELVEYNDVPIIPDFSIPDGKKKRKGTGKKKGKKGKKGKGKKSGKKKGKKKKKK